MKEGSEELTNEILKDEESCCSDTSCCPPKTPITRDTPKIGRNDRVTIKHVMSGENKTVKYKQAEPLIAKGEWVLVN